MTINFEGVTNKPYSMVMAGCFRLQDGTELAISSDFTSFYVQEIGDEDIEKLEIDKYEPDFNVKEGELCKFEMSWKLSYIFDPDDEEGEISYYLTPHDGDAFKNLELSSFLLHEDAPEDYYVRFTRVYPF